MTERLAALYRLWAALLFLVVLVQVGAAGYGAFYAAEKADPGPLQEKTFDHGFDFHNDFGYLVFYAAIILFALALAARLGRKRVLWTLAAPIIVAIQIVLAWGGEDQPIVGIFHSLNALLVFGLTGLLAHRAWRGARSAT